MRVGTYSARRLARQLALQSARLSARLLERVLAQWWERVLSAAPLVERLPLPARVWVELASVQALRSVPPSTLERVCWMGQEWMTECWLRLQASLSRRQRAGA